MTEYELLCEACSLLQIPEPVSLREGYVSVKEYIARIDMIGSVFAELLDYLVDKKEEPMKEAVMSINYTACIYTQSAMRLKELR